jgi:hypothetical protein
VKKIDCLVIPPGVLIEHSDNDEETDTSHVTITYRRAEIPKGNMYIQLVKNGQILETVKVIGK